VVTIVIVVIVPSFILGMSPSGGADWVLRVTPIAAISVQQSLIQYGQVINSYTPQNGYYPLSPLAGFAVLCGYGALALALAYYLLRRRDA
jgi:ABC-type transport system involved in multi-copper enzyme maturation permease subunit